MMHEEEPLRLLKRAVPPDWSAAMHREDLRPSDRIALTKQDRFHGGEVRSVPRTAAIVGL